MTSIQYTIRAVPKDLDTDLRAEADRLGVSLNEVVIKNLKKAKGLLASKKQNKSFDDFFGVMSKKDADEFDRILKDMRQVDPKDWA